MTTDHDRFDAIEARLTTDIVMHAAHDPRSETRYGSRADVLLGWNMRPHANRELYYPDMPPRDNWVPDRDGIHIHHTDIMNESIPHADCDGHL